MHATPTKPGRPAAGLDYVALGGGERHDAVVRHRRAGRVDAARGDRRAAPARIVVVRAIADAADPEAAARALRAGLEVPVAGA